MRADVDSVRPDDDRRRAEFDSARADHDDRHADDDSGRVDDDSGRANVVGGVASFVRGEEIDVPPVPTMRREASGKRASFLSGVSRGEARRRPRMSRQYTRNSSGTRVTRAMRLPSSTALLEPVLSEVERLLRLCSDGLTARYLADTYVPQRLSTEAPLTGRAGS
ncbi:MAG: hypothetical protein ACREXX_15505 [Gammaproteobacteria bacterium]